MELNKMKEQVFFARQQVIDKIQHITFNDCVLDEVLLCIQQPARIRR